jgi:murein DD-endopeptidase MepM/ murein hydrolase activator NlpD
VYAAAAGTVTAAGPRDPGGFGQVVYIDNDDGSVAWYGHIDTWLVGVGEHVSAGQQIATVGNRGDSSGPHLHFEIHDPGPVDPASWLRQRGVSI